MQNKLITIIIPCFNPVEEYLIENLRLLQKSTVNNFDLLLVDDGCKDKKIFEHISLIFPQVRLITHDVNLGLPAARNSGVLACQTRYFLQLDADDSVSAMFIEKALMALEEHPDWSFCNAWTEGTGTRKYYWRKGFDSGPAFLLDNQVTSTVVIRRDADRVIGGHDETLREGNEDWDYWLRMANSGFWGGTLPEVLTQYRHHQSFTSWPERDDPVKKALFTLKMWRKYHQLFLRAWSGRLSERNGKCVQWGSKKTFQQSINFWSRIIIKFPYTILLALGLRWVYALKLKFVKS